MFSNKKINTPPASVNDEIDVDEFMKMLDMKADALKAQMAKDINRASQMASATREAIRDLEHVKKEIKDKLQQPPKPR